jgi:hypothetical protein
MYGATRRLPGSCAISMEKVRRMAATLGEVRPTPTQSDERAMSWVGLTKRSAMRSSTAIVPV